MMYQGKKSVYNHNCHIVDLFPQNLNKSYSRIRLIIDADTYQLVAAVSFAKSGVIYEMKTTDYQTNATIADADINFNASRYPKVEVIDMRY
jgi:outer membrane lipoprotein-sorting protein